jgi:EAL and modified HD-GYP domain-containing signal transduction protein
LDLFISRQPIFDRQLRVYGYELFFRSGVQSIFGRIHPDEALSDSFLSKNRSPDLGALTGNKRYFLSVTLDILLQGYVHLLPKELAAVEIPRFLPPSSDVMAACKKLKEAGYLIAVEDAGGAERRESLLALADMVKLQFPGTGGSGERCVAELFASGKVQLIAEKVATPKILDEAREMNFDYFQGDFFRVPTILRGKDIPGLKIHYMDLMTQIHREPFEITRLENIVNQDVSLTYKLLRYINSAFFGLPTKVNSIRHALLLLGARETKKWATLVVITGMTSDQPREVLVQTLVRAKFCELLAGPAGLFGRGDELFLMGMVSLLDVILGRPMDRVLSSLPVPDDVRKGLSGGESALGDVFSCVLAYESAEWNKLSQVAERLGLMEEEISSTYRKSLEWAQGCSSGLAMAA